MAAGFCRVRHEKSSLGCVRIWRSLALLEALIDFGEGQGNQVEEGMFEEGTCMTCVCLALFWGMGLFEHPLMIYVHRGDGRNV